MLGPYIAEKNGAISYKGNKLLSPIKNVLSCKYPDFNVQEKVFNISSNEMWTHISSINDCLFGTSVDYFQKLGALFTPLPMTTRMISSPGAVYGKYSLDYTTDTCPIRLKWFNANKEVFLSESSQIYLELYLTQKNVDNVFSIYNSFRKEHADATHLSEFHHIEYEGKIDQNHNIKVIWGLLSKFIKECLNKHIDDVSYFLPDEEISAIKHMASKSCIKEITLEDALDLLYQRTHDSKYKKFTLKHFGSWEEVKLTNILGEIVAIREFPLLEVPFYHAVIDGSNPPKAQNADIIWPGYREIVGSGHRVRTIEELKDKARIFNLPKKDYKPYLLSRTLPSYKPTSGFGLGWERLIQGFLEMDFIWSVAHFPRGHTSIKL